jgi:hypothetical protein
VLLCCDARQPLAYMVVNLTLAYFLSYLLLVLLTSCLTYFLPCLLLVLLTARQVYCLSYLPPALLMSSPPSPSLVLMSHRNPIITAWEQPSLTDGSSSVSVSTERGMSLFKGRSRPRLISTLTCSPHPRCCLLFLDQLSLQSYLTYLLKLQDHTGTLSESTLLLCNCTAAGPQPRLNSWHTELL